MPDDIEEKLDPYLKILLGKTPEELMEEELNQKVAIVSDENGEFLVDVMIHYNTKDGEESQGTIRLPLKKLPKLCESTSIKYIRLAKIHQILTNKSIPATKAKLLHDKGKKGKGVIIGIIDTGIDFLHKAFRSGNKSRILYIWDLTLELDLSRYEKSPSFGHSYKKDFEEITKEILLLGIVDQTEREKIPFLMRTVRGVEYDNKDINYTIKKIKEDGWDKKKIPPPPKKPSENTPKFVRHQDISGHGTHVAGIAASSDSTYPGMAPEADLIVVKSDFTESALYNGINYIKQKAIETGKPFVINYSMGGSNGPRDGSGVDAREINKKFNNYAKGQALVTSAGNALDDKRHIRVRAKQAKKHNYRGTKALDSKGKHTKLVNILWDIPTNDQAINVIEIWYKPIDVLKVNVGWPDWKPGGVEGGLTGWLDPENESKAKIKVDGRDIPLGKRVVRRFTKSANYHNFNNIIEVSYSPPSTYNGDKQLIIQVRRAFHNDPHNYPMPIIPGQWSVFLEVSNIDKKKEKYLLFDAWIWFSGYIRPKIDKINPPCNSTNKGTDIDTCCSTKGWTDIEITGDFFEYGTTSVSFVKTKVEKKVEKTEKRIRALRVYVINLKKLKAITPPMPKGIYDIYVTSPGGESMVRYRGIEYKEPTPNQPKITGISPRKCNIIGEKEITIKGTNFKKDKTKVVFGDSPFDPDIEKVIKNNFPSLDVNFVSETKIKVKAPIGPTGKVDVTVITSQGSATFNKKMEFTTDGSKPKPELEKVEPSGGPAIGWTRVKLKGKNFTDDIKVFFGVRKAKIDKKTLKPTEVVVEAPPAPEQWVYFLPWLKGKSPIKCTVTVYTKGGKAEKEKAFSYSFKLKYWDRDQPTFAEDYYLENRYSDEDNRITIGPGASAKYAIAVAAHETPENDNSTDLRVYFSSSGPLRKASKLLPELLPAGRYKPEIAAPGYNITSAHSSFTLPDEINDQSKVGIEFIKKSGTSMSAPHVAGAIALLFSKKALSYTCIVKTLDKSAVRKENDKKLDPENYLWGYGRLDAKALYEGGRGKCFIATAGYGSALHPDVCFLRHIRDNILRRTRSGKEFFDEYWKYYYQFSPLIVNLMEKEPRVREIIRWSVVTPMVNYFKLLVNRPAHIPPDTPPEIREFLENMKKDMEEWLGEIEVPETFEGLDNQAIVDEINVILNFVLKENGPDYLKRLRQNRTLPLKFTTGDEEKKLIKRLSKGGRTSDEIGLILYS